PVKIKTTHVGSLPGPPGFDPTLPLSEADLASAVAWVVERQRAVGLDIINEGELTKGGDWLAFLDGRLGGFEARAVADRRSVIVEGRDREEFADFYRWAAERQTLFYSADKRMQAVRRFQVCTGPITYLGGESLQREIALLRAAVSGPEGCFLTSTAPASVE